MKAVLIVSNMVVNQEVRDALKKLKIRGFTQWNDVQGQGSEEGDPHLGTHIWPSLNSAVLTIVSEKKAEELLGEVKKIEEHAEKQGIRAFTWNIEQSI